MVGMVEVVEIVEVVIKVGVVEVVEVVHLAKLGLLVVLLPRRRESVGKVAHLGSLVTVRPLRCIARTLNFLIKWKNAVLESVHQRRLRLQPRPPYRAHPALRRSPVSPVIIVKQLLKSIAEAQTKKMWKNAVQQDGVIGEENVLLPGPDGEHDITAGTPTL